MYLLLPFFIALFFLGVEGQPEEYQSITLLCFPLFCPDLWVPGFKEQFLILLVSTLAEPLAMKVRCQPLGQLINVHGLSPVECKFVTKYTLARCVCGAMAVEGHYLSNKTYRTASKEDSRNPMLTQPENCYALATVICKGHLQV